MKKQIDIKKLAIGVASGYAFNQLSEYIGIFAWEKLQNEKFVKPIIEKYGDEMFNQFIKLVVTIGQYKNGNIELPDAESIINELTITNEQANAIYREYSLAPWLDKKNYFKYYNSIGPGLMAIAPILNNQFGNKKNNQIALGLSLAGVIELLQIWLDKSSSGGKNFATWYKYIGNKRKGFLWEIDANVKETFE
jgi:hypothetical protein